MSKMAGLVAALCFQRYLYSVIFVQFCF